VDPRRILVIGSGGREHALAWRLARDPEPPEILAAPGNAGMERVARRLPVDELDAPALAGACRSEGVDLVVVGPEAPLAAGVADQLRAAGNTVYGPGREAARLESSKWFAKEVMRDAGVPTAAAEAFADEREARRALDRFGPPWVVKADGLAAGKGVRVTRDRAEAEAFLGECLSGGRFGAGGRRVLLEEHLEGEEVSVMAVCDGRDWVLLAAARDYKRALDGDRGPNTGGMGAYAPSAWLDAAGEERVGREIVGPVLREMERRGAPFRGTLYCGLMLAAAGAKVVEFNVRFGDPETEVVLPLVGGRLGGLLAGAARGALERGAVRREPGSAVAVALVDAGYPDEVRGGGRIGGLAALEERGDVFVFHAATRRGPAGWRVGGGRAAYVTARAPSLAAARARVYAAVDTLDGEGWRARRDVAAHAAATAVAAGTTAGDGPRGRSDGGA
jgi:phosphoribosylamine--glycine ligase